MGMRAGGNKIVTMIPKKITTTALSIITSRLLPITGQNSLSMRR